MPEVSQYGSILEAFSNLQTAIFFLKAQNYQDAEKSLLNSLRAEPNFANALYLLSICMQKKGKTKLANQLKDQSLYLNPCFFRARRYKYEQILKIIDEITNRFIQKDIHTTIDPNTINEICAMRDYNTFQIIAKLFRQAERSTILQITHLSQAQLFDANLLDFFQNYYNGNHRLARLSRSPPNNYSVILFAQQKYTQCETINQRSLAQNPDNPQTFFISSHIFAKTNRYNLALQAITKAIELRSTSIGYYFHSFSLIMRFFPEDIAIAKESLQKALKLKNPRDHSCFFTRNSNVSVSILNFLSAKVDLIDAKNKNWMKYLENLSDMTILGRVQSQRLLLEINKLYPIFGLETPVVQQAPEIPQIFRGPIDDDFMEERFLERRFIGR